MAAVTIPGDRPGPARPRLSLPGLLLLPMMACTRAPEPPAQSQPRGPVQVESQDGAPLTLKMGGAATPVPSPVSRADLVQRLPELDSLPQSAQLSLVGALNLEPAPCRPCRPDPEDLGADQEEAPRSMARCLVDGPPPGCENLGELVGRGLRLAQAGAHPQAIRAALSYGEPWSPEPGPRGLGWPDPAAPVEVELWVDPSFGPWPEAVVVADALVARSATDPLLRPPDLQVRLMPPRVADADPALPLAIVAADLQGQGLPYLRALAALPAAARAPEAAAAACAGLDRPAWDRARQDGSAQARLLEDLAAAGHIGLRSAPSWRIDGYRLRGHRELDGLLDSLENQWIDHIEVLPQVLLATPPPPVQEAG